MPAVGSRAGVEQVVFEVGQELERGEQQDEGQCSGSKLTGEVKCR